MLTSTHNSRIQLARTLLRGSKERRLTGAFAAEGVRLVEEALRADWPFRFVLAAENLGERAQALVANLNAKQVETIMVADNLMHSISGTETSQGILAILEEQHLPMPKALSMVLIPDQIRDPGNLGSLLRSAAAAGVQAVLLPPETADAFAPKVVRAGMGAHFRLPVLRFGWDEIRNAAQGLKVLLADMQASTPCWQADFRGPFALIVGGEAEGASPSAREMATSNVFIPMPGRSESLNAAAAGAILLFEAVRQRSMQSQ